MQQLLKPIGKPAHFPHFTAGETAEPGFCAAQSNGQQAADHLIMYLRLRKGFQRIFMHFLNDLFPAGRRLAEAAGELHLP